jgi:hypothetical protein
MRDLSSLAPWKQRHNIPSNAFLELLNILHNDDASNPHYTTQPSVTAIPSAFAPHVLADPEPSHHDTSLHEQSVQLGYSPTKPKSGFRSSTSLNHQSSNLPWQESSLGGTQLVKRSRATEASCARCYCWKRKVSFLHNAERKYINKVECVSVESSICACCEKSKLPPTLCVRIRFTDEPVFAKCRHCLFVLTLSINIEQGAIRDTRRSLRGGISPCTLLQRLWLFNTFGADRP